MNIKKSLLDLYRNLNREIYNGTLPPINIRFSFKGKQLKTWTIRHNTPEYNLIIYWNLLDCEESELYVDMLHQMVHIYNDVNGIKDTSRNYRFHNELFAKEARRIGLIVERDENGCHTVGLEESLFKRIQGLFDFDEFKKAIITDKPDTSNAMIVQKCPRCNRVVRTAPSNNLICGFCYCDYISAE